jgi:cysteine desulfurase/selenocysteine lyase
MTAANLLTFPRTGTGAYDVEAVRRDFPTLDQTVHGHPLAYLDNAATTQKPQSVIDTLLHYYTFDNSNIHRGVHLLSQRATDAYEGTREKARRFLNASDAREIVYVRGTTEAINLVAGTWGRANLKAGDEIIISTMEHHSNIVPWQFLRDQLGCLLRVVPVNDRGEFLLDEYEKLLGPRTRLVAVAHVSNALGTVNPVRQITEMAHAAGAVVLIDGAQGAQHLPVDVRALDCDFYAFSGHKIYGPTGIGILYGKAALLEAMPPYQGGGDMIASVSFERTTYNRIPYKFEAGTQNIAGAVGLGAALDYVAALGRENIAAYERDLLAYGAARLGEIPGLRLVGTARQKTGVLSFVLEGIHPHDIGTILDNEGVAIRAGHHCTQPLMRRFGIPATARASLALYNTREDIDRLVAGILKVREVFG